MSFYCSPIAIRPESTPTLPGWRWRKLTDLARLESGHTPSRSRPDWWGGDVSWISLTEIRALDGQWVQSTQLRTNEAGIANSAARILPRGTVCFSRTASVGFVTIMAQPMATSQDFANWVCGGELDSEYLMYALICSRRELREMATGATHKTIYMPALESFHLCVPNGAEVPSIESQRQLAARLKAQLVEVETARKAAQSQVRDATLLRHRLLRQTFDTLHYIPKKVLGEWAMTTSGSTPPRGDKRYWSPADIPWVKTGEVAFAPIIHTEESISRQALAECSLMVLPPHTVLIAMYGQGKTRGQSAILEVEATTNQACFAILPNDTWDAEFLHHWLMASYGDLRGLSEGRGGNQANLNGALLNALEIPAPDIGEQRRIVQRLKSQLAQAAATHRAAAAQLAEVELLPQKLLAQAFNTQRVVA